MRRPILLFLAFAFGYFFSALLRAVTATLAPQFSLELGLGAADLGLLAGVFFAGFASMQLPLGSALDRMGPKRVLLGMMGVAVLACAAFALAQSFAALLVARTLMGAGLSAGLMAALTCFRHAYSPVVQMRATSWMLMTGSLGMLMSTMPVHALLPLVGWRGLFWLAAAGIAACAAFIWLAVPQDRPVLPGPAPSGRGAALPQPVFDAPHAGYSLIFRHPTFLRLAPMGFWHYGGLVAVQALWAGPWFSEVTGLDAAGSARGLFVVNLAMLVAFASLGALVPRLAAQGWNAQRLIGWACPISTALLFTVAALGPEAGPVIMALWCVSCVALSLSQPALGQAFPAHLVGRALSAFNLVIFLGVFSVQWGLGLIIDMLAAQGWQRLQTFQGAFAALAGCCGLSYLWFLRANPAGRGHATSASQPQGGKIGG